MNIHIEILAIAVCTSIACALPGIFLVLRGMALMSDAISHAILPGVVVMFLLVQQLHSPLLIVGAALSGLAIVLLTEFLSQTQYIKKDAIIGLLYPFFFSIGVLLISCCARNVHLDSDMVFLGELAFAPFNRIHFFGYDCGPYALWVMGCIMCVNALAVFLFYKELKLITFDPSLAYVLGFSPAILHYGLMAFTSITAVAAFDVVGAMVVVALMIVPPSTAYLCTNNLSTMVIFTVGASMISSIGGYICAQVCDVSIAGSIASLSGVLFFCALFYIHTSQRAKPFPRAIPNNK